MNDTHPSDARIAALIAAYADLAPMEVDPASTARSAVVHSERSTLLERLFRGRRAPSVAGRANPMQPMLRLGAAVAAIIAVVAVAALATRPSASSGDSSAAPPTAGAEAPPGAEPVEFTGLWRCGPPVQNSTIETIDVGDGGATVTRNRNGAWVQSVDVTDPRLEGTMHHTWENDQYQGPGATAGPAVAAWTFRIQNDQGAWEAHDIEATYQDGATVGKTATVLVGEGGFAGLYAIYEVTAEVGQCDAEVRGIIFDGVPQPSPFIPG